MKLHSLKPAEGSTKSKKRVGRGQGSGHGGTSTRGHKGAKSRSGYKTKIGFEGGQMPLQRRVPKFGFKNINRVEYKGINLDTIQALVDKTKPKSITPEYLVENGLANKKDLIKILGRGELKSKISISAHGFSAKAKSTIEDLGGKAIKSWMKNLFKVIKEIWTVDELKKRITYTLLLILVYRIGSYIVLPGIDVEQLNASGGGDNSILNLINMFAGGAFSRASIMALGIMPYISASIVMQLLGMAVPTFQRLQREGESGRKKINQYTRILTILICLFQSPSYMWAYVGSSVDLPTFGQSPLFWIQTISILTAERVVEKKSINTLEFLRFWFVYFSLLVTCGLM